MYIYVEKHICGTGENKQARKFKVSRASIDKDRVLKLLRVKMQWDDRRAKGEGENLCCFRVQNSKKYV